MRARASWSATSASIRVCASPGPARRRMGTSPSRARCAPATRWWRRAGRRSASPVRCTPATSACAPAAATPSRSSRPPGSSPACSGVCSRASQDYAYAQPSLTKKKLRRLELTAGQPRYTAEAAGIWRAHDAVRQAERELAQQAETAYARSVRDWQAAQANKTGASATPRRASSGRQAASSAARRRSQTPRF